MQATMNYSHTLTLPWSVSAEDQRRFRRITTHVLAYTLVLGLVMPWLPVIKARIERPAALPPPVATLIFEKKLEPKPIPVMQPKPQPVGKHPPVESKQPAKVAKKLRPAAPKQDSAELARKQAERSGIMAMQDALADLRDRNVDRLRGGTRLGNSGTQAATVSRSLVTGKVAGGSRGIDTAGLSRDAGSIALAGRAGTQVSSPVSSGMPGVTGGTGSARHASRSIEEIQIVFDRNKGAIYSLYNRALRENPSLKGKLLLRLTIAPNGKVTGISLLSSELGVPELEQKLIQRVKMFDFGAKEVEAVTLSYPIDFLPA
jgi:TonB family protein